MLGSPTIFKCDPERRTVVVVDLSQYSAIMKSLEIGHKMGANATKFLDEQIRQLVCRAVEQVHADCKEHYVKGTGDGAILQFKSVPLAEEFAVALHCLADTEHNRTASNELEWRCFCIGMFTGEVILSPSEIAGAAVAYATRLEAAARTGEIVMDTFSCAELPEVQQKAYQPEESVPGKPHDSIFTVRRRQVVEPAPWDRAPKTGPTVSIPPYVEVSPTCLSPPAPSPPPAAHSPLHQLPPLPPHFTNRVAELDQLLAGIDQPSASMPGGTTCITGLRGMGGIGKTALALRLAHLVSGRFPDGELFIDMRGYDPRENPRPISDALAHCVRSFYPTMQLPEDPALLRAQYLSILRERRVLFVCDNVAPASDLAFLLPPPGCLLILTSRDTLEIEGLEPLRLGTLPREDSIALLRASCKRLTSEPPNELDDLAARSGDIAEALKVNAGTLRRNPFLSVAALLQQLRQESRQMQPLQASLTVSYQHLDMELRPAWSQLAVFPGDFDVAAAAWVWGVSESETLDRLGRLENASLIQPPLAGGRIRLHDLARVFGYGKLDAADRQHAEEKHAEHYAGVLQELDIQFLAGGDRMLTSLKNFDAERINIQAAFERFSSRFDAEPAPGPAARLSSTIIRAGAHLLEFRLPVGQHMGWLQTALTAARQASDRAQEAWHLAYLGLALNDLKQTEEARPLLESAIALAREIGDRQIEGDALSFLGISYQYHGDMPKAFECHLQAREIHCGIGDRRGEANDCCNLGVTCGGALEERLGYYTEAIRIAREIGSRRAEAFALAFMAQTYLQNLDHTKAAKCSRDAVQIRREIGDLQFEISDLGTLINAACALRDWNEVIACLERQAALHHSVGNAENECLCLLNLALAHANNGSLDVAVEISRRVRTKVSEDGSASVLAEALRRLAACLLTAADANNSGEATDNDLRSGIAAAEEARQLCRVLSEPSGEASALFALAYAKAVAGKQPKIPAAIHEAIAHYDECLALRRQLNDRAGEAAALGNLGDAWQRMSEWKRARRYSRQALAIRREVGDRGGEGLDLANLAIDCFQLGRRARAIVLARCALPLLEATGSRHAPTVRDFLAMWTVGTVS
jgi:tetratricopeptide (TPR) repeat protein/class 3 adenylate cyclase